MQGLVVLSRSEFSILRSSLTNPASSWDKYIEASFQTRFVTAEIDIENELARMQGLVESMRMQHASTNIKTQLSTLETSLAVLSRKLGEQDTAEDRTTVLHYIENHTRIVAHLRRGLRKALLKVRANQVAHQKTVRRNLFDRPEEEVDGATTGAATHRNSGNHSNLSTKARIASKNKSFTDGLSRTRALLSSEIKRSAEALASLETGVNTIVDAKKEYAEYGQALGSGKSLINQLTQREITDRVLTVLGFVFFLLTVLYIAQNRLGNVVEYLDIFGLLQTTATPTTAATAAAGIHADVQETATAVLEETLQYNQEL
jgi:hypothetical protein